MTKRTRVPPTAEPAQTSAAQKRLVGQRAAAARERIAAAQHRHRIQVVGSCELGVIAVVAALVVLKVATGAGGPRSGSTTTAARAALLREVADVPAGVLNDVGAGNAKPGPIKITAPAVTAANGKPEVLYVGAEYCPYCAAERWAVAIALSHFGTLHGVGQTASSPDDVYPSTSTLSFHGSTYTSSLLVFIAREIQSNKVVDGQYAPLDTLTKAQQALVTKYNAPPYTTSKGSIPFVDIGGEYVISGASYSPGVLQGKSHTQIASALSDAHSAIADAVDGTANLITAAVCATTEDTPAAVCTSPGVRDGANKLAQLKSKA